MFILDITEDSDYRWIDEINVVNRGGKFGNTTSSQELPFVCKVASKDAPYNKECGVYSNGNHTNLFKKMISLEVDLNKAQN